MASALPSTFRRAWSEFSLRFRVMTELSPPTLNFLTMFATVPMLIPCDLAQSACFKTGGWASSKSSNILHLLARVSFVDLLRSILLSNETSSSDRLTEYDFGLAIVTSPLVVSDGRKYITGLYKCQCVESLDHICFSFNVYNTYTHVSLNSLFRCRRYLKRINVHQKQLRRNAGKNALLHNITILPE